MTSTRAVRIVTEVAAVDRPFDYAVTDATRHVAIGDRVRVDFHHRSVRGWVVGDVAVSDELKPLTKWLGYGPPERLLELMLWASERWCSSLARFLVSSSPSRLVTSLPDAPRPAAGASAVDRAVLARAPGVWQFAPTEDPLALVLEAYETSRTREGSLLVLVPTESWARRLRGRLEQRGCAVASGDREWDRMRAGWPVVVGPRGAALAPVPRVAGAVIIDADDEAYRSESAPTWDVVTLLRERCRRDDAPLWCTSMIPSPVLLDRGGFHPSVDVAGGWPRVAVADRRLADPHEGALGEVALQAARRALDSAEPVAVVVILQRLGTGRLFACRSCGELARCTHCGQAEGEDEGRLVCREGHERRANFCQYCGATNLKRVKVGVSTLAHDVGAQLAQVVTSITASSPTSEALARVVVGTEAVWQRVRRCGVVIFMDFDQYLLAPRESARRTAITSVGKAGRLVGSRREGRGVVVLQTRRGDDPVLAALASGDVTNIIDQDVATAALLALAPYSAWALVSGDGAREFVDALGGLDVRVRASADGFTVQADDVTELTSALRAAPRPSGKLRIAVQ